MARAQSIAAVIYVGLASFGLLTGPLRVAVFGSPARSADSPISIGNIKADTASATLRAPLQTEQMSELFQGLSYLLHDNYPAAAPILGKYALMGDARAQNAIGAMYYAGMGFPADRAEAIRWFRLAAAQGGEPERETLISAINGTWQWNGAVPEPVYASNSPGVPQPDFSVPTRSLGNEYPRSSPGYPTPNLGDVPTLGARRSIDDAYGSAPASGRSIPAGRPPATPPLDFQSSPNLFPAGPGTYSDDRGNIYTQAGPHGVVDTQTGEFTPTN